MAGLEISGTQSGTSTRGTTGGQPKSQQNQNIVIEFSSLPDKLKTKDVRAFYDKDGSGFIEAQNDNGQNEYALMADFAKSMGIDLSKYKSNITKVVRTKANHEGTSEVSRAYDANGKWVMDLEIFDDGDVATYEASKTQHKFSKLFNGNNYAQILEQDYDSSNGGAKHATKYLNGMTSQVDLYKNTVVVKDKNGKVVATENYSGIINILKDQVLVKGKNTLVATQTWTGSERYQEDSYSDTYISLSECIIPKTLPNSYKVTNTTYTLNGKPVQAKPIGKGRYEVTDNIGNVSYISHDGVNLKPEYVRNNP